MDIKWSEIASAVFGNDMLRFWNSKFQRTILTVIKIFSLFNISAIV